MTENTPVVQVEVLEEIKRFMQNLSKLTVESGIKPLKGPLQEVVPYIASTLREMIPAEVLHELFELVDPFVDAFAEILSPIFSETMDLMFIKVEVDEENPAAAAEQLIKALLRSMLVIGIIAVIPELAHPLKSLGLSRLAPAIVEVGGFSTISSSIASTFVERTAIAPLRYALNRKMVPYIPDRQDLVTMLVREVISPEEFSKYYSMQGFSKEWTDRFWKAHWRLPSISSLYEMFWKGLISEQDLHAMLVRQDYDPNDDFEGLSQTINWPQKLAENAYTPIPRVDVRFAYEDDIFDETEVYRRMKMRGFSEEDAETEAKIQIRRSLSSEREDVRRQYQQDYEYGWLEEEDLRAALNSLQYTGAKIDYFVQKSIIRRARSIRDERARIYALMFRNNKMSEEEFRTVLTSLGMTSLSVDNMVDLELLRRKAPSEEETAPELTVSQLGTLYKNLQLTEEEFRTELANRGYSESDIEKYLLLYAPSPVEE